MARSTRGLRLIRARRNWKTYARTDDPVSDVRRWDAAALAAIDGGGCLRPIMPLPDGPSDIDGDSEQPVRRSRRTRSDRTGGKR